MLKSLLSIILSLIGMCTSALTADFGVYNRDSGNYANIEYTVEFSEISKTKPHLVNLALETNNAISILEIEPASSQIGISIGNGVLNHQSEYLSTLLQVRLTVLNHIGIRNHYLRETLFPFHSFW